MDAIADGVATGDFHAQPSGDSCRYCDFKMLCGSDREKAARAKQRDPHVAEFMHVLRGDTEWVPELVVPTGSGDVRFRGFIDRLGLHPDGTFSVLDYKTGRVLDLEDGEIGDGTDLQLPLYMLAGAQALGLPVEKGAAAYEFVSRRNGYARITLTGRELNAQHGRFQQVMDAIADGVATGDFHAQPSGDSCRYCDFKMLCGSDREKAARAKQRDPHVAEFMHVLRGDTEWVPE